MYKTKLDSCWQWQKTPSPLALGQLCTQATHLLPQIMMPGIPRYTVIPNFTISINGTEKMLTTLKPHKAADPDYIWPLILNTLRPRRNEQHFAEDIFKRIFFNENVWILIQISLKFVPNGPINNIPALVKIMSWRRSGDKPLSEPMMVSLPTHICVTRPQWVKELWDKITPIPQVGHLHKISQATSHYLNQWWLVYQRIYASRGLNELRSYGIKSPQFHKSVIFIRSVKTGKLPSDWKKVNGILVFKKGSKQLPVNYRLVWLTFICCKLMEHAIVSQIRHHLDDNITRNQHGFEHGLSCETQLVHELHQGTIKWGQVDTIMDCTKAFDKIKGVSRGDFGSHGVHCDTGQYWLAGWLVFVFR